MGLPCDARIQQIKEALVEKDVDVEKLVQMTDYRTKKSLPLFKAVMPNSDRNKKIFNLTDLLNLNVSVERIGRRRLRRLTNHEKGTTKPEANVPKCVNCGETGQVAFLGDRKKFRQVSKTNFRKPGTTDDNLAQEKKPRNPKNYRKELPCMNSNVVMYDANLAVAKPHRNQKNYQKELPRMNSNMDASEPATDLQDIIYIMQEFRKLFGKFNDAKTFAQQLRNAKNSVEKFELFSAVFLD
ncbi:hypothetical protein AVEN_157752-1 [Araneus ventricosus]|uniref:Pre-C2HC domain-containing protein n=1 Tax=Araneus ventricosus TaxID=182803 RepID=A0A4Y2JFS3_ARAVE|nr:hypothetical protein AVEN_157752-1 [Araneus ventricosus]